MQIADTAILIFSRTAREEAAVKQFGYGKRRDIQIAQQLIEHTHKLARLSGISVVESFSGSQHGSNFGQRFVNAIDSVFSLGFSRIIAIGTDSPGITTSIIREVHVQLKNGILVTGPSPDGGVHIIGLCKSDWHPTAFLDIPWQTEKVQQGLSDYAKALDLTQRQVQELSDLDNNRSLLEWISKTGFHNRLVRILNSILKDSPGESFFEKIGQEVYKVRYEWRRGPPGLA